MVTILFVRLVANSNFSILLAENGASAQAETSLKELLPDNDEFLLVKAGMHGSISTHRGTDYKIDQYKITKVWACF